MHLSGSADSCGRGFVGFQCVTDLTVDHQLFWLNQACFKGLQRFLVIVKSILDAVLKFRFCACPAQAGNHLFLHSSDPDGCVAPAGFQSAHFDFTGLKNAEIAVGNGDTGVNFRRQKSHPTINAVQIDGQASAMIDFFDQLSEVFRLIETLFLDPKRVHIHVQHFKALFLSHVFSAQQDLTPASGNRFVRFNTTIAGVFVAQKAKTDYQEPLKR